MSTCSKQGHSRGKQRDRETEKYGDHRRNTEAEEERKRQKKKNRERQRQGKVKLHNC